MVHLSSAAGVEGETAAAGLYSVVGGLRQRVEQCSTDGDLDAYIAAMVLSSGYRDGSRSPWHSLISGLLAEPAPEPPLRSDDVAVLGCRAALGDIGVLAEGYADAADREIRRGQLGPIPTLRSDERILLGVAAGIGRMAPHLKSALASVLRDRRRAAPPRQLCIDLWAESLAEGSLRLTQELAHEALDSLVRAPRGEASRPGDQIARFWLATRLLDATLSFDNDALSTLEAICHDGRRSALMLAGESELLRSLDAALLLDALSASPVERLARRSALAAVLNVIDGFEAAASVLANRYDGRPSFTIKDEYDVQDLFRALALPAVPDIEPEDPAPKVAGKGSRLDFTSRRTMLGFELKHVKPTAGVDKIRKEILIDERTFHTHPYVETVVVFVYDPNRHVVPATRVILENDLSAPITISGRTVEYIVRIRG